MLKELYTAALGMMPQQTRLEVIANNLANAGTNGFKRDSVFERNLIDARANFYNVPGDVEQDDPPTGSYIDFKAGASRQTNNPLDLAIADKNNFFMMQDEEQNIFLSKDGHFTIGTDGTIQAMDGKLLMGAAGPINLYREFDIDPQSIRDSKALDINIAESGEVFINEVSVGTIQIAEVENLESLQKVSASDFIVTKDTFLNYINPDQVSVKQGWIEESNVNIVSEMVTMIELNRAFEAGSKVIQTNNETLDKSIALGRFY
jgi:flagellar basal-body rod protein FlgF